MKTMRVVWVGLAWTLSGCGTQPDAPVEVAHTALEVVQAPNVSFPDAGFTSGLTDVSCTAEVTLDAEGIPSAVTVTECPEPFLSATTTGLHWGRWKPVVRDGTPVPAIFRTRVRYQVFSEREPAAAPEPSTMPADHEPITKEMVKVRRPPTVRFPAGARDTLPGVTACYVAITIDTEGKPTSITATDCPEVFRSAAEKDLMTGLWTPYLKDGVPTPAGFTLRVKYTLSEPEPNDAPR